MGIQIGKISPIKKAYSKENGVTIASSLSDNGLTRWPGTYETLQPYKERDGSYRTGLDEDALYIREMKKINPKEAEMEIAKIQTFKEMLSETMKSMDLSPKAPYYTNMFDEEYDSPTRARLVKLIDGPNTFSLSDVQQLITYAWVRVHPAVAPSFQAWKDNMPTPRCKTPGKCKFYVDDYEYEAEVQYKEKIVIDKAITKLVSMSPTKRLRVAKLLGLPVGLTSKEEVVYNELNKFINTPSTKGNKSNVDLFEEFNNLTDTNLSLKYMIHEAYEFNVLRKMKGEIYKGNEPLAKNEEALIKFLMDPKNQEEYLAIESLIEAQKSVKVI